MLKNNHLYRSTIFSGLFLIQFDTVNTNVSVSSINLAFSYVKLAASLVKIAEYQRCLSHHIARPVQTLLVTNHPNQ